MYSTRNSPDSERIQQPSSPTHVIVAGRNLDPRAPRATLMGLPPGPEGTRATLRIMKKLANDAVRDPRQIVRAKAIELYSAAGLRSRQWVPEIQALQRFVQNSIRYMRDPEDVELVQTPEVTLKVATGDCDDQATLLASMLKASGHPAQFVAIGLKGGPFSHVLVETRVGTSWLAAETILKKPFGWYPPDATSRYVLPV